MSLFVLGRTEHSLSVCLIKLKAYSRQLASALSKEKGETKSEKQVGKCLKKLVFLLFSVSKCQISLNIENDCYFQSSSSPYFLPLFLSSFLISTISIWPLIKEKQSSNEEENIHIQKPWESRFYTVESWWTTKQAR